VFHYSSVICHSAIWRHTYSAAITTFSDSAAVLTLTIVVLVVALLL